MWTHLFFKYPRQNSGTVPVPEYKVETLYSGTKVGTDILGTQRLNTAPFCAGVRALVLGHQVWTRPKFFLCSLKSAKTTLARARVRFVLQTEWTVNNQFTEVEMNSGGYLSSLEARGEVNIHC